MRKIKKVPSLIHQIKYSKVYRAPVWLLRKIAYQNLDISKEYTVPMRLGHQIKLRPTQRYLENVVYNRQYHDETIFFIKPLINENSVIIDIGANIGLYTCAYAEYFKEKEVKVYAIEALATNFGILNDNIKLNCFKNIESFNLALGKEQGELEFILPTEDFVGNAVGANVSQESAEDTSSSHVSKVKMVTLDQFAKDNGIKSCDFLKIDVEGAEMMVFSGGKEFLSQCRPVIEAEYNAYWLEQVKVSFQDFAQFFSDIDYLCAIERDDHFEVIENPQDFIVKDSLVDLLFIPNEKIDLLL